MNGRFENEMKLLNRTENIIKDLPTYVQDWYYNIKANKFTASTCYNYILIVKKFINFIEGNNTKIEDFTPSVIDRYFNYIQSKNGNQTSDSYYNGTRECLLCFFDFLCKRHYIEENYIKENTKSHKNKDLNRINQERILLSSNDFNDILNEVKNDVPLSNVTSIREMLKFRDYAIMMLFMNTGIRRQALTNINIEDINFDENELIQIDKGNVMHNFKIKENLRDSILDWMKYREIILKSLNIKTNALFISYRGKRINAKNVCDLVYKYSERALGYRISPHKLRSGCVSILYQNTGDIEFCRRFIGHSNISTTQRYIVTNNIEKEQGSQILDSIF